ncbi:MAG: alpha/beta fold hydrolase [Pseudanabaena sp.]|jgi:pimeloyl-ACP methyl ester carboxylesterase
MKEQFIMTSLGRISVLLDDGATDMPIIYLHGVFMDKTLWTKVSSPFKGRMQVFVDMPAHGSSDNIGHDWSLNDCAEMLIRIMDELNVQRCVVIGHSWGSMTALRAAIQFPDRFAALGLFNMPFRRTKGLSRIIFALQKSMTIFPAFFAKQAAKQLYSPQLLEKRPELITQMQARLSKRPAKEIARTIKAVILEAEDAVSLIQNLQVPAIAVIGETDYVGIPPKLEFLTVSGGHISPQEAEEEARNIIKRVLELAGHAA